VGKPDRVGRDTEGGRGKKVDLACTQIPEHGMDPSLHRGRAKNGLPVGRTLQGPKKIRGSKSVESHVSNVEPKEVRVLPLAGQDHDPLLAPGRAVGRVIGHGADPSSLKGEDGQG
jgi:hypothetical protein